MLHQQRARAMSKADLPRVTIYTDGAQHTQTRVGGWAVMLLHKQHEKVLAGSALDTTNTCMEMQAVIEALRALKRPCRVRLYCDCQPIVRAMSLGWVQQWKDNDWKRRKQSNNWTRSLKHRTIKHAELWEQMLALSEQHEIDWIWIESHTGDSRNERVDGLARQAMRRRVKQENKR